MKKLSISRLTFARVFEFIYLLIMPGILVTIDILLYYKKADLYIDAGWFLISMGILMHLAVIWIFRYMCIRMFKFTVTYESAIPLTVITAIYNIKENELWICMPFMQIEIKSNPLN